MGFYDERYIGDEIIEASIADAIEVLEKKPTDATCRHCGYKRSAHSHAATTSLQCPVRTTFEAESR